MTAVDAVPDPVAASAPTGPARIRELMLANLFAVFNERDPDRRLEMIARNYTQDVIWSDPDGTTHGHAALNEQAQRLLDRLPGFVFSAAGPVHVSRDLGLLAFNAGNTGAAAGRQRHRRGAGSRWTDRGAAHSAGVPGVRADTPSRRPAALADPAAQEFLRHADPVLGRLIDARPDFRPRAWMDELPPLDAFGTLVFQVAGQQLSVASTRAIVQHLQERFGGHMPSAAELLAADPQVLRDSGFSARKGATLRALAERFVDGRLSDEALSAMSDEEVEAALTEVPGIGLWSARGFLLVALDRPDVFLTGDLALRRAIRRAYDLDHLPTEDEVAQISDRWRPYRSLAVSYLFASEYGGST